MRTNITRGFTIVISALLFAACARNAQRSGYEFATGNGTGANGNYDQSGNGSSSVLGNANANTNDYGSGTGTQAYGAANTGSSSGTNNSTLVGTVTQPANGVPVAPTDAQGQTLQVVIVKGDLHRDASPQSQYCGGHANGWHANAAVYCPSTHYAIAIMVNCQNGLGGFMLTSQLFTDATGGYVDCCVHENGGTTTYRSGTGPVQVTCVKKTI